MGLGFRERQSLDLPLKTTVLSCCVQRPESHAMRRTGWHKATTKADRWNCTPKPGLSVLAGKRFLVSQHTGSQRPISEPEVVLEAYRKESTIAWGFFPFPEDLRQGTLPELPLGQNVPVESVPPVPLHELQSDDEISSDGSQCDATRSNAD